jgi:hypothetical protein
MVSEPKFPEMNASSRNIRRKDTKNRKFNKQGHEGRKDGSFTEGLDVSSAEPLTKETEVPHPMVMRYRSPSFSCLARLQR